MEAEILEALIGIKEAISTLGIVIGIYVLGICMVLYANRRG